VGAPGVASTALRLTPVAGDGAAGLHKYSKLAKVDALVSLVGLHAGAAIQAGVLVVGKERSANQNGAVRHDVGVTKVDIASVQPPTHVLSLHGDTYDPAIREAPSLQALRQCSSHAAISAVGNRG
jgi:hypothetical protein